MTTLSMLNMGKNSFCFKAFLNDAALELFVLTRKFKPDLLNFSNKEKIFYIANRLIFSAAKKANIDPVKILILSSLLKEMNNLINNIYALNIQQEQDVKSSCASTVVTSGKSTFKTVDSSDSTIGCSKTVDAPLLRSNTISLYSGFAPAISQNHGSLSGAALYFNKQSFLEINDITTKFKDFKNVIKSDIYKYEIAIMIP
ncbi:MAG: hypothetical protein AB1782_20825 [Cyanobacteriota bacterium]